MEKDNKDFENLGERLEKELYGQSPSERRGKVKKIWGIKKNIPKEDYWHVDFQPSFFSFLDSINIKKIFIIVFLLFLISGGVFSYIYYFRAIYIRGISFDIIGPNEVNSLNPYEYKIKISNNSNIIVKDVYVDLNLDEGIYNYDDLESEGLSYSIGELMPKETKEISFKLIFIGKTNENLSIKGDLIYKTPNKNQTFNINKEFIVTIKKEPISYQFFVPSQVFVNEPFMISFKFNNNSSQNFDFNLDFQPDNNFEFVSISPPPQEGTRFRWNFNNISPGNNYEINIVGKFTSFINKPILYFYPRIIFKNKTFKLKDYTLSLNIIESPIILTINTNKDGELVNLGDNVVYTINWQNKSRISLNNVQIKVYLEGYFDMESLSTDGYFSPLENSIVWNAQNKPELYNLQPNSSGALNFSIRSKKKYEAGSKDLFLKVKAVLETTSIPPEVQILSNKLSIETQDTKIIAGNINIKPFITYYDDNFSNIGVFPLEKGKETTLSFYIDILTIGEDFEDIILKTKIPIGVKLTGNFTINIDPNNLQYNEETGEFIYRIDALSNGYGDIYGPYRLGFQISVLPPLYGEFKNFVVIPKITLTAKGKYSKKSFEVKTSPITIYEINKQKRNE
jgi:hypothetical protein